MWTVIYFANFAGAVKYAVLNPVSGLSPPRKLASS